jgi:hypothetical protein
MMVVVGLQLIGLAAPIGEVRNSLSLSLPDFFYLSTPVKETSLGL